MISIIVIVIPIIRISDSHKLFRLLDIFNSIYGYYLFKLWIPLIRIIDITYSK